MTHGCQEDALGLSGRLSCRFGLAQFLLGTLAVSDVADDLDGANDLALLIAQPRSCSKQVGGCASQLRHPHFTHQDIPPFLHVCIPGADLFIR